MGIIVFVIVVAVCVIILIYKLKTEKRQKQALQILRDEYQLALKSGNKRAALEAGRIYYSSLRNGKLTIYDEQALSNDLAAMP